MFIVIAGMKKTTLLSLFLISISLLTLPAAVTANPIYVYKENGVVKFSNKPPASGTAATVFKPRQPSFSYYRAARTARLSGGLFKTSYTPYIKQASYKYRVDPALIRAVIHAESSFNPSAISPKGAKGLMQLMDDTRKRVGVTDVFSPAQNIDGGVRLLALLLKKYKGNQRLALAAYNAGEGAVARYGGIPPYRETQDYVEKVLHLATRYKNALYD